MSDVKETLSGPAARSERGRRRGTGLAAALVSGVLVSAAIATPYFMSGLRPDVAAEARTMTAPSNGRPIQEVWPEAVHAIPKALPDLGRIRARAFLDDTTLLVTGETQFEKADGLYAYDLDSGKVTRLADIETPDGAVIYASGFTTGNDRIFWWTGRREGNQEIADIWSVPSSGGEPKVITSTPLPPRSAEGLIEDLTVTPEGIAWSAGNAGVFRAPFTGGPPELIRGTEGQHILRWPWVGSPGPFSRGGISFTTLRNVETGERRDAVSRTNSAIMACGVTRCVSRQGKGVPAALHSRTGQGQGTAPVDVVPAQILLRDRFVMAPAPDGTRLFDVATNTSAVIAPGPGGVRAGSLARMDDRLVRFDQGDKVLVVDLDAIR